MGNGPITLLMDMVSNTFQMSAVVTRDIGRTISNMAAVGRSGHQAPGMKVNTREAIDMGKVCTIMLMAPNIEAALRIANLMERVSFYGLMAPSTAASSKKIFTKVRV